tara:strand:+ start:265 stop:870 length:606 start_codon:yes stop_codon:yes gene_type:complete
VGSIFLGIAGGSCSGKTTLVNALEKTLPYEVSRIAFDSYYCDQGHLPISERALVNYDHPDSLDVSLFIDDLRDLRSGKIISSPVYDFATHTRSADSIQVMATDVVILDGILLLVFPEICELLDLKVFVDAPETTRASRRVIRDEAERGRTAEQAKAQILRTVKPMHAKFVEPSMKKADLVIDGEIDPTISANQIEKTLSLL